MSTLQIGDRVRFKPGHLPYSTVFGYRYKHPEGNVIAVNSDDTVMLDVDGYHSAFVCCSDEVEKITPKG